MAFSQNLQFSGRAVRDDELEHPAGASIAKLLRSGLAERGWQVSLIDNWRDCGWSVECTRSDVTLEAVVSSMTDADRWFLQIAPSYRPGIVGRLFGKVATAKASDILAAAQDVHAILAGQSNFDDFKWCWDGYPEDKGSTSEPISAE